MKAVTLLVFLLVLCAPSVEAQTVEERQKLLRFSTELGDRWNRERTKAELAAG